MAQSNESSYGKKRRRESDPDYANPCKVVHSSEANDDTRRCSSGRRCSSDHGGGPCQLSGVAVGTINSHQFVVETAAQQARRLSAMQAEDSANKTAASRKVGGAARPTTESQTTGTRPVNQKANGGGRPSCELATTGTAPVKQNVGGAARPTTESQTTGTRPVNQKANGGGRPSCELATTGTSPAKLGGGARRTSASSTRGTPSATAALSSGYTKGRSVTDVAAIGTTSKAASVKTASGQARAIDYSARLSLDTRQSCAADLKAVVVWKGAPQTTPHRPPSLRPPPKRVPARAVWPPLSVIGCGVDANSPDGNDKSVVSSTIEAWPFIGYSVSAGAGAATYTGTATLQDLPDEVLARIIGFIDVADRLRLVLTCRGFHQAIIANSSYRSLKSLSITTERGRVELNDEPMRLPLVYSAVDFLMARSPNVEQFTVQTSQAYSFMQQPVADLFVKATPMRSGKPARFAESITSIRLGRIKCAEAVKFLEQTTRLTKLVLEKLVVVENDEHAARLYALLAQLPLTDVVLQCDGDASKSHLTGPKLLHCVSNKKLKTIRFGHISTVTAEHVADIFNSQTFAAEDGLTLDVYRCPAVKCDRLWSGVGMGSQIQRHVLRQLVTVHLMTRDVNTAVLDGMGKMPMLRDFGLFSPYGTLTYDNVKQMVQTAYAAMARNGVWEMVVNAYPFYDTNYLPYLVSEHHDVTKLALLSSRETLDYRYPWFKLLKVTPNHEYVIVLKIRPHEFER